MVRRLIDAMVTDLIEETSRRLAKLGPKDADAIRRSKSPVVAFSAPVAEANRVIKEFLMARMYRHWRVNRMTNKARKLTAELFAILHTDPTLLPDDWRARAGEGGSARAATIVCDYIAGMTDRYAMDEHRRLTDIFSTG
jgi:dGTPase